jgi:predicted RNase H-like HicB family nuclease/DNA-binding XRE family transcriptional regulator
MKPIEGYYAILYSDKSSGKIGVRFDEHPGVITYGKDPDDALRKAREALSAALEVDFERGLSLPAPVRPKKLKRGETSAFVRLNPDVWVAYLIRSWREAAGLSQKELAAKLGVSYQSYQRMERPGRSNLTVETLERIAEALYSQLILEIRPTKKAS